jgi:hypothetical protein
MRCEVCKKLVDDSSIVEWKSLSNGLALSDSIRIVHRSCDYSSTESDYMMAADLYDHWLPLYRLDVYLEIATEMKWDDLYSALSVFMEIIQVQLMEVQNEND